MDQTNNLFYNDRILKFNDIVEKKNYFTECNMMPIAMFYQTTPSTVICEVYSIMLCTQNTYIYERKCAYKYESNVLGGNLWNSLNTCTLLVSIMSKYIFKHHYVTLK